MSGAAPCACGTCASCASCAAGAGAAGELPGRRGPVPPERTHAAIKARLLEGLAASRELDGLSVDADDDPSIAVSDAWAAALHVLSFYVERYWGESYLDTATGLDAVDALARMVGYRPAPALSASTVLSFRVDDTPGAPPFVTIPPGMKVQTVPRPGELPAVFETGAALEARPEWNLLEAQRWRPGTVAAGDSKLTVNEIQLAARPGDVVAIVQERSGNDAGRYDFAEASIDRLERRLPPEHARAEQVLWLDRAWGTGVPSGAHRVIAIFSRRAAPFAYNAPTFRMLPMDVRQRIVKDVLHEKIVDDLEDVHREWPGMRLFHYQGPFRPAPPAPAPGPAPAPTPPPPDPAPTDTVDLDAIYPEAYRGRHVLLSNGSVRRVFRILQVEEASRTQHGVTSRVSRLKLSAPLTEFASEQDARNTSILIQTEQVTLADLPVTGPAPASGARDRIALASACTLPVGRLVVLRRDPRAPGAAVSEVARVKSLQDGGRTVVFEAELANTYDPHTLVLLGNVARATHGETRMLPAAPGSGLAVQPEVIGSGDARRRHQAFALRQPGLSFLPSSQPPGYAPELEVRVQEALRPRVESLYGRTPGDPAYVVETAVDASARVRFAGRLPTAAGNVTAVYRVGGGAAGNLAPDRLVSPLTMPGGLREVSNPVPATGGAPPEDIESARRNAPMRVVTFDRIVSLGDYEAFARAYPGITQASATLVWSGHRQVVSITVAGPQGDNVPAGSDLHRKLQQAIRAASAPGRNVRLLDYVPRRFGARIAIARDPALRADDVRRDVAAALAAAFGARARSFGAPVARSHLLAVAHCVPGVIGARVASFRDALGADVPDEILGAAAATTTQGAELLVLDPALLEVTEMPA